MRLQYQSGELVYSDAIRWEDIATIWDEVHRQTRTDTETGYVHLYRLQRKDGTFFGEADYKMSSGKAIVETKQEMLRYCWSEVFERYQRGLPVPFGPLTIIQHGIQYQEWFLTWAEISMIDCSGSGSKNFIINVRREKAKERGWPRLIGIPLGEVPNVHVLRRLLIIAREQQAPPHFRIFGVFPKEVSEVMAQSYAG